MTFSDAKYYSDALGSNNYIQLFGKDENMAHLIALTQHYTMGKLSNFFLQQQAFFTGTNPFYNNTANKAFIQNNKASTDGGSGENMFNIFTTSSNTPND
jgi:hypothetical protein